MPALTKDQLLAALPPLPAKHWHNKQSSPAYTATHAIPAAGTYYINMAGILKPGLVNLGVAVQPHGFSFTPSWTLAHINEVIEDTTSVPWKVKAVVADQDIAYSMEYGNVLRVNCSGPGILRVACI